MFLHGLKRREFNILVADLFISMGFHLVWTAPPDKVRGKIDLIVNRDPLGAKDARVFVQICHGNQLVGEKDLRNFINTITPDNNGVIISTSGFVNDLNETVNADPHSNITLLNLESFFDLWVKNIKDITVDEFFNVVETHAKDGVDFMTIHAGLNRMAVERVRKNPRLLNIVSRGGSVLLQWMAENDRENPIGSLQRF